MKTKVKKLGYPLRSGDVPVTQRMLFGVRDQLSADIRQLDAKLCGANSSMEARLDGRISSLETRLDARISSLETRVDGRISSLEAKLEGKIDSRFHELSSQIHQIKILVEEQNARNIIVMDGLTSLYDRQDRLEAKVDKL